jgi:hypothetical protein
MLRLAAAVLAMAIPAPAWAADWYYIDSADDGTNISFIDKDSLAANGDLVRASMFSLLAEPDEEGGIAFRFTIDFDCKARTSRLISAEIYDEDRKGGGEFTVEAEAKPIEPDTQGDKIGAFVCSGGKVTADTLSAGKALPFETGRAMLAERAPGK